MTLPRAGSVLGVDVGVSPVRRSGAACRLDWTADALDWTLGRFRAAEPERGETLGRVGAGGLLLAAAFDGPLRRGFDEIGRYRAAERLLTRRLGRRIGKPGQSNSPVGRALNAAANRCALLVRDRCRVAPASHPGAIDALALAEAFPSSFMGVLLADPALVPARRADRSDRFFVHLGATGPSPAGFGALLRHLLPGRRPVRPLDGVVNHDDRAALVCAFTALALAAGDCVIVGDDDGAIVLPPRASIRDWAWADLVANASAERDGATLRVLLPPPS